MDPNATMPFPHQFILDDCKGYVASFDWVGSHERFDPPPHPGWEPPLVDDGEHYTGIQHYALGCERLSLGAFERPVRILVESADLDAAPKSCMEHGDWNVTFSGEAMETIFFDDEEVVEYLRDAYDMPAYYADIQTQRVAGDPHDVYNWTMVHEDGATSWFETLVGEPAGGAVLNIRMFWWNSTHLGYLDWGETDLTYDLLVTMGHAEPPLAVADWHTEYRTTSNYMEQVNVAGPVWMFTDFACREPVE